MSTGYRVENPATGDVVETFDTATDAQLEDVLSTAVTAQREWAQRPDNPNVFKVGLNFHYSF